MIEIDRDLFYKIVGEGLNLAYVEEIQGFKKSRKPTVNLFEVMKRLDLVDIYRLMDATGNHDVAFFIAGTWFVRCGGFVASFEGFDCYYPPEIRRDAILKRFIRDRDMKAPEGMKLDVEGTLALFEEIHQNINEVYQKS